MPVRLVADGEAGHVLPVATPDVPGGLGVERLQVTDRVGWGAEQAQRVDDLHPGRGGEGKQVIDSGEAIAARTGRDQLIHRAPADSEAAQSQITRKGDERAISRSEQAARHTGVAGIKRPPFETQPSEIIRNHRPGMLTVNGDRYGMGACPGAPRHGRGRNHPHPQPGRLESASYQATSNISRWCPGREQPNRQPRTPFLALGPQPALGTSPVACAWRSRPHYHHRASTLSAVGATVSRLTNANMRRRPLQKRYGVLPFKVRL